MSVQTDPDGKHAPRHKASWFELFEDIWMPIVLVSALIALIVLAAISVLIYPVARLLGFDSTRWWKEDVEMPGWFLGVVAFAFVAVLAVVAPLWIMDLFDLL